MKTAIIGAGACGLMLALLLDKNNLSYDLFNKGKIGRKILASGNGKCNISNTLFSAEYYHNNPLSKIVLANQSYLFDLFKELKIYTKTDSEGRMYPISESSQSVLNIFLKHIKNNIIDLECNKISCKNDKYYLNDTFGPYDNVVIATGSNASFKTPYNDELIKNLYIDFIEFKPSLVGFKVNNKIKEISGVRAKCKAALYQNNKLIHEENGEVIFKDNGISGICIMNLSSYYNNLTDKSNSYIILDLLNGIEYDCYESVLAPKLYQYIIKNNISPAKFILNIKDTYEMEFAQVAHGGININELEANLMLKKHKNIFAGGEVINIDGVCGGYNLMFAFTSAIEIFKYLKNEVSNN